MTTTIDYSLQEKQSLRFLREIKHELGYTSTQKIVKLVRAVLYHVRSSLSHEQASLVIRTLPGIFQLLFITNWRYEKTASSIKHLDELVDHIYLEDRRSNESLFTSEIDTLNKVIVVLGKLDKFFGILGLNLFRYPLTQELKQVTSEETL
jgi:uncharacterized protein (DUF2267 family)